MRILQVTKCYYPYIGGIEQVTRDCAKVLSNEHETKVFCFNHAKKDKIDYVDGVEVIRAGCFAKISSQMLSSSYGKLLKKTFLEFRPDVVIFHYPNPFAAHYLLKTLKKYPECQLIVYWHADIVKQKILKNLFYKQGIRLCKRAKLVVGATPIHLNDSDYYKFFKDKCRILPYCIDENCLQLSEDEKSLVKKLKGTMSHKTVCFSMGRHVPYKGLSYLIQASKYLNDNYIIFIAGDGPLTKSLQKEAEGDSKIVFLGKLSDSQRRVYLSLCDIFCFPSITRNENFGLALAEAMHFQKPAVTFSIPHSGVNYVSLNNITGIEVENGNAKQFAEAIEKLSRDDELRKEYGKAAQDRVVENFTSLKLKNNISRILEELS